MQFVQCACTSINGLDYNSMDNFNLATLNMEPRKWIITIYNSCDQASKIDHVSANYTELYFAMIFHSECNISSMSFRRKLNSAAVMKILVQ